MDTADILLFTACVVLFGNCWRAQTRDSTVVALAALFGLVVALFTLLPSHGWYVISSIGFGFNITLYVCVFFGLLGAPAIIFCNLEDHWNEELAALAMGIWTVDIWGLWLFLEWAQSLPADSPQKLFNVIFPVMHWIDDTDGPARFRPMPHSLLAVESSIGFAALMAAIIYSLWRCIHRCKAITPDLRNQEHELRLQTEDSE